MQWVLEDSEIAAFTLGADGTATLRLSAGRVVDEIGASEGSGEGAWQPLLLTLAQVQVLQGADAAQAVGRISSGFLEHQGQCLRRLPLPTAMTGPVVLEWEMALGDVWRLQALGLALQVLPGSSAVDALQC